MVITEGKRYNKKNLGWMKLNTFYEESGIMQPWTFSNILVFLNHLPNSLNLTLRAKDIINAYNISIFSNEFPIVYINISSSIIKLKITSFWKKFPDILIMENKEF